jgi:molybdate transport system substrate-binding protein
MHVAFAGSLALVLLCQPAAVAAEIKVLSAGAVEPGLHKAVERFAKTTGHAVKLQFNTAPQIAQHMQEGYIADVVIAPPATLKQQTDAGRIAANGHATVGRVGVGITVYDAALATNGPEPGAAREFVAFLATAEARQRFAAAGVE